MSVRFDTTREDFAIIEKIAVRAKNLAYGKYELRDAEMDISACHRNGNPLRLADLLAGDDFNFIHDVFGIRRNLDRNTGKLLHHFCPRFAA